MELRSPELVGGEDIYYKYGAISEMVKERKSAKLSWKCWLVIQIVYSIVIASIDKDFEFETFFLSRSFVIKKGCLSYGVFYFLKAKYSSNPFFLNVQAGHLPHPSAMMPL